MEFKEVFKVKELSDKVKHCIKVITVVRSKKDMSKVETYSKVE